MTTIRSFIAIELSKEAQAALAALQQRLKDVVPPNTVRWTAVQNIHLTLHFLGDITPDDAAKVAEMLQHSGQSHRPFSLRLEGLSCFPNLRRPRIVWVGVGGDKSSLVDLHTDLGRRLKVIDFTPESRPYSPHLTVGRIKKGVPPHQLRRLGQALEQEQAGAGHLAALQITEISLMRSDLKPSGPVYTPLAHGVLGNSA
jgi:2'-5' RNA ligase